MTVRAPGYIPVSDIISVSWGQIKGKPGEFPPAQHTHIIGDITGLQAALDTKLSSVSWQQVTDKPLTFAPSAHTHAISDVVGLQTALDSKLSSVSWSAITNKPATFPPSAHTHVIGDITGLQAALDSKLTTVSWSSITDKPATFPPSAHAHVIADVTGLQAALDGKPGLGNSTPAALGTAAPGSSTSASRQDHVHPLPTGRVVFIGNVTISQNVLISLSSGMVRTALTLTGVTTADRLMFAAITPCTAGCEAMNVYATAANEVTVSYNRPALGIGAVISIPLAIYRVT